MAGIKLTLNLTQEKGDDEQAKGKAQAKAAANRKASANETIEEAWQRIFAMRLSDKDRKLVELAKDAYDDGKIGRLKDGKMTKQEAIQMGKRYAEKTEVVEREKRAKETLENKPDNYYVITDDDQLPKFLERLREECRLQRKEWADRFEMLGVKSMTAGDFEGTGIDSYIDLSIGFSIWLPLLDEGYYLPYGHVPGFDVPYAFQEDDAQLTRSKVLATISPYLSQPTEGKTFHMGAARYDLHIAENDGYTIKGCVWDTLDAMRNMYEHEESYALKELIKKYGKLFGVDGTVHTFEDLFGNRSPAPYNVELVGIYAINDVKYGWSLFEWQFEIMAKRDKLLECYALIDSKLPETDVFLERSGFLLDFEELKRLENEFRPKIKEAEQRVFDTYKIDDEFIRKMDRKIKANKIQKWIKAQENRIKKKREQIQKKKDKLRELEEHNKTHLKSYQNEKEMLLKYEKELSELVPATEDNAPQEVTTFEITNSNHIGYLIYDHLGIADKTYKIDKSKTRSVAADVLEMYYEDEPSLEPLATVAEYTKLLTTYIEPMLGSNGKNSVIEVDGRVHTNFKAGGTRTGRYASKSYTGRPQELIKEVNRIANAT